jgi:hypothetical protein
MCSMSGYMEGPDNGFDKGKHFIPVDGVWRVDQESKIQVTTIS